MSTATTTPFHFRGFLLLLSAQRLPSSQGQELFSTPIVENDLIEF
ncbi:hypothetical protein [Phaeodactylibacter luteus]|nr:hypothetical protein [Phaeodactylibacter luteus]